MRDICKAHTINAERMRNAESLRFGAESGKLRVDLRKIPLFQTDNNNHYER